jgi:hypothetical protein
MATVYAWMKGYSEELAEAHERRLKQLYPEAELPVNDYPEISAEVDAMIEKYKRSLVVKVPRETITPNSETEKKYSTPSAEVLAAKALRLQWIRECFNPIDGKPNERHQDFEQWERKQFHESQETSNPEP